MEVDIACVGFGPATGGFLTTLTREWSAHPEDPAFESKVAPGMPLQVLCYERADDIASGVSGVVTRAQGIRASFPDLNPAEIPMAAAVAQERVFYLLDPVGASRRSALLRLGDKLLRVIGPLLGLRDHAFELPWTPAFLHKHGGLVLSIGQFNQWVGQQLLSTGLVQIWPGTPVSGPLLSDKKVLGLRLADQGVDRSGAPADGFMPGMDIRAQLTVVGDGPVGQIGKELDQRLGTPEGHARSEWALGMKFVIELPPNEASQGTSLQPGTVWHTFGYPEPEIFGFLYVHPDRLVSVGIFVPSWLPDPARTAYRYLQHYIQHPALWKVLKDGTLRSWGAKSLDESGRRGEPFLVGDGYARIGEGSGSTNMLTGSGVDEAWTTGTQLGEAVLEILRAGKPFTKENLAATYEARRRASWVEQGARVAEHARDGFHAGFVRGLIGMALAGLTGGKLSLKAQIPPAHMQIRPAVDETVTPISRSAVVRASSPAPFRTEAAPSFSSVLPKELEASREQMDKLAGAPSNSRILRNGWETTSERIAELAQAAQTGGRPLHDALLSARGWPEIAFDGRLLVTQQDALLMGGKVQAMPGFADHVLFRNPALCENCLEKTCVAMCSGQAITQNGPGVPAFEREKCIHCGACLWNCAQSPDGLHSNIEFRAGSGGLHSAEN
jgi:electron-transferring-flavoprotein dehydrogenase